MGYVGAGAALVSAITAATTSVVQHKAAGKARRLQSQGQQQAIDQALSQRREEQQQFAALNPMKPDPSAILDAEIRRNNRSTRAPQDLDSLALGQSTLLGE